MSETKIFIEQLGAISYLGVFGISIIANVIVPLPEEVALLVFGYLAGTGKINGFVIIPIIIAGAFLSDVVMYELSKRGSKIVTWAYDRLFAKRLESRRVWLEKHMKKVIFFARFLVQLRFLGPFLAGQSKISRKTFIKYDLLALIIYVPVYVFIGWYFRDRIEFIASGIGIVKNIIIIIIGIGILVSISVLARDIIFGGYRLSLKGKREEQTVIPGIYKIKKEPPQQ